MLDDLNTLLPDAEEIDIIESLSNKTISKIIANNNTLSASVKYEHFNDQCQPWLWNNQYISEMPVKCKSKVYSFVYRITNNITGKFYIGYKQFYSKTTKIVKHKKKHVEVESDWQKYWSSGELLHADIQYYGKGNYTREILALCPNKAIGKFVELCYQIKFKVCTENADKTFNNILNVRLSGNGLGRYKEVIYSNNIDRL